MNWLKSKQTPNELWKIQEMKTEFNNAIEILKKIQTEMKTSKWKSSFSEVDHLQERILMSEDKIKELDHSLKGDDKLKKIINRIYKTFETQ